MINEGLYLLFAIKPLHWTDLILASNCLTNYTGQIDKRRIVLKETVALRKCYTVI